MTSGQDRMVYQREDGLWANKRNDAKRASSIHGTRKEAEDAARSMLRNEGGGQLITSDSDGKIRSSDTIVPGSDP